MKQQLVIVGAGGFGRELYGLVHECVSDDTFDFKGFLALDKSELAAFDVDAAVLDPPEVYDPTPYDRFLLAIGHIEVRRRVVELLLGKGAQFIQFIHATAVIARTARLGKGVVVYPFAVVSNQANVGDFVHLSLYASVGHDARVDEYSLLAPYATLNGAAVIESEVFVSTHATIAPERRVGARSKISANSVVLHDVPPDSMVYGVPGKQARLSAASRG